MPALNKVQKEYGKQCYYCNLPSTTIDHYVPLSRGGSSRMSNLRPSCEFDNTLKADRLPVDWWKFITTNLYRMQRAKLINDAIERNGYVGHKVNFDDVFSGLPRNKKFKKIEKNRQDGWIDE